MKALNGDFVRIKDEGRKGAKGQRHRVKEKDKGKRQKDKMQCTPRVCSYYQIRNGLFFSPRPLVGEGPGVRVIIA